ncbi:hypothetical protein K7X08_031325 [Anisodus acutangulus]|uniref:Uncharacterized protein n=1 Tax=Anisodus acutangulus TaxID=402998 RepID=A0A9Q1ML57_9SOLA|nr:hypothetical protein K7X08_031325 [Anisodus acutangulus]
MERGIDPLMSECPEVYGELMRRKLKSVEPSGVQTGASKGRTEVLKQDGQHVGKAQAVDLNGGDEDSPKGADIGGQPPEAQTGAGKGRNWKLKGDKSQPSGTKNGVEVVGQPSGTHTEAGKDRTSGDMENDGQPMGTQTGVGKGRTLDKSSMDGQPTGTQTGVGKGRILDKEAMKKVETGEVTYGQPSGSQTEAGKGGNKVGTAKEQIFAPQTVRSKGPTKGTTTQDHSAISPAVKQSAIFSKLAAMHENIEVQSDTDQKARTAIEIAMAQGGRIDGSSTGGQPSGAQTEVGKGRTDLVAQPVGPLVKVGKGGNYDGVEVYYGG